MKNCPFCAEEIKDEAIVCKHCGRSLEKEKIITSTEKNILFNKITEYISKGYMIVSSGDDRAVLERRYPFSTLLFILLLLGGLIGGIIYGIYIANKRLIVQLFLNSDGTISETGETLKVWRKRILKRKSFFSAFFSSIISFFLLMMLLGFLINPAEMEKDAIVPVIIFILILSIVDFILIKKAISLSKEIKEIK